MESELEKRAERRGNVVLNNGQESFFQKKIVAFLSMTVKEKQFKI